VEAEHDRLRRDRRIRCREASTEHFGVIGGPHSAFTVRIDGWLILHLYTLR
jgi:hypothetical protein